MLLCDLDQEKFIINNTKAVYKKNDNNNMAKVLCVNCNKHTTLDRLNFISADFFTKFGKFMRCLPTYDQLKIEQHDMLNYVKPIMVLEHVQEDVGVGYTQEVTELKIGVNFKI